MLHIGQLQGKTEALATELAETKTDVRDVYNKVNATAVVVSRVESKVDDLCSRPTTVRQTPSLQKTKAWDKPLGELAGEIFIQALKILGIGVVIALILYGIGHGDF